MNDYLLETDSELLRPPNGKIFLCPFCSKSYTEVKTYSPVKGLSSFFSCEKCGEIYVSRNLKVVSKWKIYFCCFCLF